MFQVKKLSLNAKLPHRATSGSAGYDLFSAKQIVIPSKGNVLVSTDISISLYPVIYGRIAPRSGLGLKHSFHSMDGVVDSNNNGEIVVALFNFSDQDYQGSSFI